jgi:hypothetical protein
MVQARNKKGDAFVSASKRPDSDKVSRLQTDHQPYQSESMQPAHDQCSYDWEWVHFYALEAPGFVQETRNWAVE